MAAAGHGNGNGNGNGNGIVCSIVAASFREAAFVSPHWPDSWTCSMPRWCGGAVVRHNAYAAETGDSERFVTALVVEITPDEQVPVANCGHGLLHLLRDGVATALRLSACVPLGLAALADTPASSTMSPCPLGRPSCCPPTVRTHRDPRLRRKLYPLSERLQERASLAPDELPLSLYEDARRFSGRDQHDDITLLTVHRVDGRAGSG
ncbi:hypothetical protein ACFRAO_29915 [Streptomyces sp. NPDC056656]|uniref:hypothetical protein n=1 Tax=Streptomyces sp. NPDC056656 TaxID=3345895 RepID=UPI00367819C3